MKKLNFRGLRRLHSCVDYVSFSRNSAKFELGSQVILNTALCFPNNINLHWFKRLNTLVNVVKNATYVPCSALDKWFSYEPVFICITSENCQVCSCSKLVSKDMILHLYYLHKIKQICEKKSTCKDNFHRNVIFKPFNCYTTK